ncbi:MAG: hypothetical protein ISS57_02120 [Anaerolineales bacterium]|nr:hypothetical protein [Anaerolineales bacterium]
MNKDVIQWLLDSEEPWTRYRFMVDVLDNHEADSVVQAARAEMLAHPQVQALIATAQSWPVYTLKRHNDAKHALYAISTLADFGLRADDPGVMPVIEEIMAHQASEGAFLTPLNIGKAYGSGEDQWSWMACDAPTLLYALLSFGLGNDPRVQAAVEHLTRLVDDNGWRCVAAPKLGKFRGPGRKADPCPIANVYALKALPLTSQNLNSPAARKGVEMLLWHWEHQTERKIYLFGLGGDFRKLKYPFVWYDILHVTDVLSRFPFVHDDPRFLEMVSTITDQANEAGRYTANSMYMAWKSWSFANKKEPSP